MALPDPRASLDSLDRTGPVCTPRPAVKCLLAAVQEPAARLGFSETPAADWSLSL